MPSDSVAVLREMRRAAIDCVRLGLLTQKEAATYCSALESGQTARLEVSVQGIVAQEILRHPPASLSLTALGLVGRLATPARQGSAPSHKREVDIGEVFFNQVRGRVDAAFNRSAIKRTQQGLGVSWAYDVCAVPFVRGGRLVLGMNWAPSHGHHAPQAEYPSPDSWRTAETWQFIGGSRYLIDQHFRIGPDLNYFNVSPFRSSRQYPLSDGDWALSIEEFFLDTIAFVRPSMTLLLSTSVPAKLRDRPKDSGWPPAAEFEERSFMGVRQTVKGMVGDIIDKVGQRHPFRAVPHTANVLAPADRERIWHEVLSDR